MVILFPVDFLVDTEHHLYVYCFLVGGVFINSDPSGLNKFFRVTLKSNYRKFVYIVTLYSEAYSDNVL